MKCSRCGKKTNQFFHATKITHFRKSKRFTDILVCFSCKDAIQNDDSIRFELPVSSIMRSTKNIWTPKMNIRKTP